MSRRVVVSGYHPVEGFAEEVAAERATAARGSGRIALVDDDGSAPAR